MIESTLTGGLGVTPLEGGGVVLTVKVAAEEHCHIPLPLEPLMAVLRASLPTLTEEQKRELVPLLTSGIVLPGLDGFKQGPNSN